MLKEIRIISLGIIDDLTWDIDHGLNIISGETGSGKSLIIEALEILFFESPGDSVIRHGSEEARVEAYFNLDVCSPQGLLEFLEERKLHSGSNDIVITAHLKKNGRNIFRINSTPVPKKLLEHVGGLLLDIHGQTQHLSLYDRSTHLRLLDKFGCTAEIRDAYSQLYSQIQHLLHERARLQTANNDIAKRRDYLYFQMDELEKAGIKPGEDAEIEKELIKLTNIETVKRLSWDIYQSLRGDYTSEQSSAFDCLSQALGLFSRLAEIDPRLTAQFELLQETCDKTEELGYEVRRYVEELDGSPERIEELGNRLELIGRLKRKYGGSMDSLLLQQKSIRQELEDIGNIASNLDKLDNEIRELMFKMADLAQQLTSLRLNAARELEHKMEDELAGLNMPEVVFKVCIEHTEETGGLALSGKEYKFGKDGIDNVEFFASTNPGEPVMPIANIASTGEISRFTLALKNALAGADAVPTMIFDEIDIGVGGRSGEVIGRKLWSLGRHHQIICITHLPQIAAFADSHFKVCKTSRGNRNTSTIRALNDNERIEELAAMISPRQYSEKSLDVARELSLKASVWKKEQ
ncbi:MAG: DNA repair protein RecN [Dehalococcoidaceae bacterium]|nr:DNA repair protein RecN [Dehalococcoidaceae bacterium]